MFYLCFPRQPKGQNILNFYFLIGKPGGTRRCYKKALLCFPERSDIKAVNVGPACKYYTCINSQISMLLTLTRQLVR